ncbi:hypothetical protein JW935_22600 [candidate division KSB1 bacterium]|nr:hypothetical protein [candidate division KSB1 bacterium]
MDYQDVKDRAEQGISGYLTNALKAGKIDRQAFDLARKDTIAYLNDWMNDENIDILSPNFKAGVVAAIGEGRWEDIVNAYRKKMSFGTGGIRGLMASRKDEIIQLKIDGIDAKILKGPNTLNNVVLLLTSAGVAKFGQSQGYNKIVIGYDSRIRGGDFAQAIAELFLAYGFTVFLFDAPCPYPEVTFAIPYREIHAHIGILISASHNDYRYNGYKLSCGNGSQFDPQQREVMYNDFILTATTSDIKLLPIKDAPKGQIIFLGAEKPLDECAYYGHTENLINIHKAHANHVKTFLLQNHVINKNLKLGFCAFHGAGRIAVPRILNDIGFKDINIIKRNGLNELNGLFPSFCSDPGREQQPDPGDPRAAKIAVEAYQLDFPGAFEDTDIIVGTDPDADRCGVVVKVPEEQRFLYKNRDYMLLPADDMWALLVWFRLKFDKSIVKKNTFITLSHITSDSIVKLARKNGIGVIKTWVGFANLAASVRDAWDGSLVSGLYEGKTIPEDKLCHPFMQESLGMDSGRKYNLGAMEQSNGFSLLGFPPPDEASLGVKGHVRDKDGTFAAVLMAEIADWAKKKGTGLFELVDENIYLDPDIGLFVNFYEPDPMDGEYPGIEGDQLKKSILKVTLDLHEKSKRTTVEIGGYPVISTVIYRTGKYDHIYVPTSDFKFPDEGVRFYFDKDRLSHLTVRPSGTTNSLRFHVQLHSYVNRDNIVEMKKKLHQDALNICTNIRELTNAPRNSVYY